MKSFVQSMIASALLSVFAAPAFAAGYPLTCVFDGNQQVAISPSLKEPTQLMVTRFVFKPATKPASLGVDPGTCAWADRAFRQGEPNMVAQIGKAGWTYVNVMVNGQEIPVLAPGVSTWAPFATRAGYKYTFSVNLSPASDGIAYPYLRAE